MGGGGGYLSKMSCGRDMTRVLYCPRHAIARNKLEDCTFGVLELALPKLWDPLERIQWETND